MLRFAPGFILILLALALAPTNAAQETGWDALNLSTFELENTTVHYEKELEPQLAEIREAINQLIADVNQRTQTMRKLTDQRDAIFEHLNQLLGTTPTPQLRATQKKIFDGFAQSTASVLNNQEHPIILYLARRSRIKEHLRSGGQLPDYTYNASEDTAIYRINLIHSGDPHAPTTFTLGIESIQSAVTDIQDLPDKLQLSFIMNPAITLHELIEGTILYILKPRTVYYRWLSDGFANAFAMQFTRQYVGEQEAQAFEDAQSITPYAKLKPMVNLATWMNLGAEIKTPLKEEGQLANARYAFATHEAKDLIETYGQTILKKILAQAQSLPSTPDRFVKAASAATGEDIAARLAAYQTFDSPEKAEAHYNKVLNEALSKRDSYLALRILPRINELQAGQNPKNRLIASHLLHKLGHTKEAVAAYQQQIRIFQKNNMPDQIALFRKEYVAAALQFGQPQAANEVAEQILADNKDDLPALIIRLNRLGKAGQYQEAKATALRIIELEPDPKSLHHRVAQQALGVAKTLQAQQN